MQRTKRNFNECPKELNKQCKVITDYFPIRRSGRKNIFILKKENQKHLEDAILCGMEREKKDGYEIKMFPDKGRGVITTKALKRGQFVMEYHGELIDYQEAIKREKLYAAEENIGCYMYYFKFNNKCYCIDATEESGRLGRLINHSKKGNLKTQIVFVQGQPHLAFFACRDIDENEELAYDYGDRSKLSLQFHSWLAA